MHRKTPVQIALLCLGFSAVATAPLQAAPAASSATASTSTAAPASTTPGPHKDLSDKGQLLDSVVAVVNDGVVLRSELDQQEREITARLRQQNVALPADEALRSQVLERLVLNAIQDQRADRAGIKVSDEQLNIALGDIAKRQNISFEQLPDQLALQGLDYPSYREEMRREMARQMLRDRDVGQRIVITPRELDLYIQHEQKTASSNNEYNVAHILIAIAADADPAARTKASKLAHDIDTRLHAGEDFGKLAITYSQSETALEGGALGWRKGTELPTFLADVIAGLQPGQVSDVIETSTGFHIVKLNERRSAGGPQIVQQVHLRHILIKPTEIEDDATVQQKLARMRDQLVAGKDDFVVLAKTNSQDPTSAVNGGDLGWSELDVYAPDFANVAASLKEGEISEPFHTQYGWHIVQLLGRRDFDNSKDAARERAYEALRGSRLEEATELWLQQIRDESYVDLRM
jgi:peptidyl-prolyl cis-trans isomerase SurA